MYHRQGSAYAVVHPPRTGYYEDKSTLMPFLLDLRPICCLSYRFTTRAVGYDRQNAEELSPFVSIPSGDVLKVSYEHAPLPDGHSDSLWVPLILRAPQTAG